MTLTLLPDGSVRTLESDDPVERELRRVLGVPERSRASHIRPVVRWKRAAFRLARLLGLHRWTRTWRGPWEVWVPVPDGGAKPRWMPIYSAATRAECVAWERDYFNSR